MKIKKTCQICGKEFMGSPNQKYCSPRHDFPCPVCGEIKKNVLNGKRNQKCQDCASKKVEKTCEICGKKFKGTLSQKYCSPRHDFPCPRCGKIRKNILNNKKHQHCPECAKLEQEETMMKKYGYKTNLLDPEVQEQIKQTNLKKYGVENPMQNKEIRDRAKKTNLERYGAENAMQSEEIQKKQEKTMMKKYGYKTNLLHPEVQEQIKRTNLEKYGVENFAQSDEFKKMMKNIWENKTEEERLSTIKKTKETLLEKYGVDSYSKTEEFKIFMKEWYEGLSDSEKETILQKRINTNLEKYGVPFPMMNSEIIKKTEKTNMIKYGVPNHTFINIENFEDYQNLEETLKSKRKNVSYWADYFNMNYEAFRQRVILDGLDYLIEDFYYFSQPENNFIKILENFGISKREYVTHTRKIISPMELDFFFPSCNLAVEISPTFTHCYKNESVNPHYNFGIKERDYHYKKFKACKDKGIRLITLFDWVDPIKVVKNIKEEINSNIMVIKAEDTLYKEIKASDSNSKIVSKNCSMGALYYNDKKVMTFIINSIQKDLVEIRNLTTKEDCIVENSLLKIIEEFPDAKEIIYVSDNNIYNESGIKDQGFDVLEENKENLVWYNVALKQKIEDKDLNNVEKNTIVSYGFLPIYDTGYTKWIKRIDKK